MEAELLSEEELEHLCDVELVAGSLDEYADLLTASALRVMRSQRPA